METTPESLQCSKGMVYLNLVIQAKIILLGMVALREKPKWLAALIAGWILNLTVFRFNTCMNCDYYGKDCHLGWGRLTARLFKRSKEPDREVFRRRFPVNFLYLALLFWLPLPAMREQRKLLASYIALLAIGNLSIAAGCRNCSMKDACPLGERMP